jgi:hypothetical protein
LVSSNFWLLCCLSFRDWRSFITPFGFFNILALVLCVLSLTVSDYHFWYLQTVDPCVVCPSVIDILWLPLLVSSNFWPLCCLSFCDWRSLIIPFGIYKLLTLCCLSFCDWRSLITPLPIQVIHHLPKQYEN